MAPRTQEKICCLKLTNFETVIMFENLVHRWFAGSTNNYNEFIKALLSGNLEEMNYYMNKVTLTTFSSFDVGTHPSEMTEPGRFYHGFCF